MSEPLSTTDLLHELAEDLTRRCQAGERPTVEEYVARHPEMADELRAVLPAILMMEEIKPRREEPSPKSAAVAPMPDRIGEYRLIREIGRGGMGIVYEAEQEALGRRVALKVLLPHLLTNERLRARFRREAKAMARLHHTNIVPVFGVGEQDGQCFYVMQLIQGRELDRTDNTPLTDRTRSLEGSLPIASSETSANREKSTLPMQSCRDIARIGCQVADALAYAHGMGVLHRDIKPSNLMLDEHGAVWVTDFGVAKILEETNLTQSGDIVGTLRFMPPERFTGQSDARGDIYSLGITQYELLAGRPAFPNTSPQELIYHISHNNLPSMRTNDRDIPTDLETIVLKAAARDPAHRYQTADELGEDLRRFLADRPILARRASHLERAVRWSRRNPAIAGLTAAAFVLLLAITVISAVAYFQTAAANRETESALLAEQNQREQAEGIATVSLEALARVYDRFAPTRLVATAQTTDEQGVPLPAPSLPPEAAALLDDLLLSYERIARSAGEFPRLFTQAAEANHRIGDIRQRLGRTEAACDAYRLAIDLYSRLPADADDPVASTKSARAAIELGRALRGLQKIEESDQSIKNAIQALAGAPESIRQRPENRYELARAYYLLGQRDMLRSPPMGSPPPGRGRRGSPLRPEGDQPTRQAISLLEELVAKSPSVREYRHLLACCYRDAQGPPHPGGQARGLDPDRGIGLLRQLVKDFPKVPDYRLDLCEALAGSGPPDRSNSNDTERMQEAIDLSSALVAEYPSIPDYKAAQGRYLDRLGMKLLRAGEYDEAQKVYREAIILQGQLAKLYPDVIAYGFWLCLIERSLGEALANKGELSEAKAYLKSATERAESLRKKAPHLTGFRPFLGMAYRDLSDILSRTGEAEPAAKAKAKANEFGPPGGRPKRP